MKLYKTTEKLISENYPYGFRLRTTKTDYLEFQPGKGFRHCSFTIDPRTGRQNNPKKSTYYNIMVLGKDENNYTKSVVFDFYDHKSIDRIVDFFSNQDNFNLFTPGQIESIYIRFIGWIRTDMRAQVAYCGSKAEDLIPLYNNALDLMVKGAKEKGLNNYFGQIKFDWNKIDSLKVEGYQPFKMVSYGA